MQKTDKMPLWVFLAFSSIESRKGAQILIWSCLIFSFYCIPWASYFTDPTWLQSIFLIEDWSWAAMTFPMVLWYWLSMRWIDKNAEWEA